MQEENNKKENIKLGITEFSKLSEIRRRIVLQCKVSQRELEYIRSQIPQSRTLSEHIREKLGILEWWNNK